jgi:hypothetical protein
MEWADDWNVAMVEKAIDLLTDSITYPHYFEKLFSQLRVATSGLLTDRKLFPN